MIEEMCTLAHTGANTGGIILAVGLIGLGIVAVMFARRSRVGVVGAAFALGLVATVTMVATPAPASAATDPCIIDSPAAPIVDSGELCAASGEAVTTPRIENVTFSQERNGDTITVTATATGAYTFASGKTVSWDFDTAANCDTAGGTPTPEPTVEPSVSPDPSIEPTATPTPTTSPSPSPCVPEDVIPDLSGVTYVQGQIFHDQVIANNVLRLENMPTGLTAAILSGEWEYTLTATSSTTTYAAAPESPEQQQTFTYPLTTTIVGGDADAQVDSTIVGDIEGDVRAWLDELTSTDPDYSVWRNDSAVSDVELTLTGEDSCGETVSTRQVLNQATHGGGHWPHYPPWGPPAD